MCRITCLDAAFAGLDVCRQGFVALLVLKKGFLCRVTMHSHQSIFDGYMQGEEPSV